MNSEQAAQERHPINNFVIMEKVFFTQLYHFTPTQCTEKIRTETLPSRNFVLIREGKRETN